MDGDVLTTVSKLYEFENEMDILTKDMLDLRKSMLLIEGSLDNQTERIVHTFMFHGMDLKTKVKTNLENVKDIFHIDLKQGKVKNNNCRPLLTSNNQFLITAKCFINVSDVKNYGLRTFPECQSLMLPPLLK